MTAVAGFWGFGGCSHASEQCAAMLGAQAHYGLSGPATAQLGGFSFGTRLYPLLPEDRFDRQPLVGGGGRFGLVADARLDNRHDLAKALAVEPHRLAELADSDLLLIALKRWDAAALDRIVGDYAFAFFDLHTQRLMLARDPLGQRPLFWHRGSDFVAFSSMPAGLHALHGVGRRPDAHTMARFIARLPHTGPASFYETIQRVEPGHVVTISADGTASRRYWAPARAQLKLKSFDDYVEAFRAELDQAVACRLRGAEGVVAAHLSAGWDSSSVTATAARLLASSGGRVAAFTSVPRAGAHTEAPLHRFSDEGPLAARTAALYENVDHHRVESSGRSPLAELDRYAATFDRPLYNLCNHVWLADIRNAARAKGARILLTGEIGNWTISSAPSALLADYVRQGQWRAWWREARLMVSGKRARLRGVAANSFGPWIPDAIWSKLRPLALAPELHLRSALHPALRDTIGEEQRAYDVGRVARPADNSAHTLDALSQMDFGEYRKGVLAGWGIDKRDATADRRLIEFCLSLPTEMLLKNGVRRPLARAALSDRLPPAVLDEPRKGYQAADWSEGLAADRSAAATLVEAVAADPMAASLIDVDLLRRLVRDWPTSGWAEPMTMGRYRTALLHSLWAGHFILSANRRESLSAAAAE